MPSLVAVVKKKNEILRIVQSVALGVCFSIYKPIKSVEMYELMSSQI